MKMPVPHRGHGRRGVACYALLDARSVTAFDGLGTGPIFIQESSLFGNVADLQERGRLTAISNPAHGDSWLFWGRPPVCA